MSEGVRPVRAWIEREEWQQYLQWDEHAGRFIRVSVPTNGERELGLNWTGFATVAAAIDDRGWDPLRSLRVLLSTGHEVQLDRRLGSVTIPQGDRAVMLDPGCMKFSLFAPDGMWLCGGWYMPEVTDAEAVARALAEAVAWVQEAGRSERVYAEPPAKALLARKFGAI